MSIGKISEFDMGNGIWTSYADRLEMYFKVNNVADAMKVPIMISAMGDGAYELLVNLASPKKPAELTFKEASELLSGHLQPTPSVHAERYRFRQRRQQPEENINGYVAELKRLARNCEFGTTLNENLRDQFICGLRGDVIRQRLFAEEKTVQFNQAVKIASTLEAAERDAAAVEARGVPAAGSVGVHAMETRQAPRATRARQQWGGGAGGTRQHNAPTVGHCKGCGATTHEYGNCKFREYECSQCGRRGHLRRVCRFASSSVVPSSSGKMRGNARGFHYGPAASDHFAAQEETEDDSIDLHQLCLADYKPVSLPIKINNNIFQMEVDTGTPISCISKSTYDRYFNRQVIEACNLTLTFYDGTKIKPIGFIRPSVEYNGVTKQLELFVIDGGTTSLLGRQWLAELNIPFGNNQSAHKIQVNNLIMDSNVSSLLNRYKQLFDGSLGRFTGGKATLRVREGAAPVFHRARPMPYALRERVDAELDRMLRAGVIEPVDCSDWASPLVPINKSDGTLRVCVDYKATLNPVLLIDRYPLPRFEEVLMSLQGAQFFSKIDLSHSYNQIELDDSKKFTVINTHRGLYRYNRLVFGLASSPGIFQRIMTNLLHGIPNVAVFIDDVIIGGETKSDHITALQSVFQRLQDSGLKLKKSKCVFLAPEVSYLGFIISKDGVRADPTKIEAVKKIPRPQNVSELRSFLGLVNFFAKFIKSFSSKLVPLYNLLRKGVKWNWSDECEVAFTSIKNALIGSEVLAHYDPCKPLIVTCDASPVGVGGVLSQPSGDGMERPVAFVSRTLTPAEKNYSQIHREALAIIFCMKKFHQYIYGRRFILRTDHKPLVSIFGPNSNIPVMTASRMQRWAIILSAYNYDIEYVRTTNNSADGLSRLPLRDKEPVSLVMPEQTHLHFAQEALLLNYNEIKKHTARDPVLGRVLMYIKSEWPTECDTVGMQPYFNRKRELYEELGCVMWGHRVVVPEFCRDKVLKIIHEPHMGIVKSKALARSYVWWAGIDEAVEGLCRACPTCAAQADAPPRQAPIPWTWPKRPWTRLHLDFLGPIFGKLYFVVVDAMSKWIEIFQVPSTAASSTIDRLGELWSRWGLPKQVVSDNGPPFTSQEFATFLGSNGVEHVFSSPYHPSSNGAAENAVKTVKRVIKKAVFDKQNVMGLLNKFLLYYRNTPHSSTGESPAKLLQGRQLRTRLDGLRPDLEARVKQSQQRQVENAAGRECRIVRPGEEVWYRQYLKGEKWLPGTVDTCLGPSNYKVLGEGGSSIHRHIDQIKRRSRSSLVSPSPESSMSADKGSIQGEVENDRSDQGVDVPKDGELINVQSEQSRGSPYTLGEVPLVVPGATSAPEPQEPSPTPNLSPRPLVKTRPVRQCRRDKITPYSK